METSPFDKQVSLLNIMNTHLDEWEEAWEHLCDQETSPDVARILDAYYILTEFIKAKVETNVACRNAEIENSMRRWTPDEDEKLLELATNGVFTTRDIASALSRTPSSVQNRLSVLFGRERKSKPVSGRFEGIINDQETTAKVVGRVYKEETARGK